MSGDEGHGQRRRRSGRRPGETQTRPDLLQAARTQFSELGYDKASVRGIARSAKVDSALVHHFFATKAGVFSAAISESFSLEQLMKDTIFADLNLFGPNLVSSYLKLWENPETGLPLKAALRSAITNNEARDVFTRFLSGELYRYIGQYIVAEDADRRLAFAGSQLVGLALMRYLLDVEPLASASHDEVVKTVGPVVQWYLIDGKESDLR